MEDQTIPCKSISGNFLGQFESNVENETVYGGDVIKATDLLTVLSDCLNNTDVVFEDEDPMGFTMDIIKMCDEMINQTVSWNEIGKDEDRFVSSSNIFQSVDTAAFQLLESEFDGDFSYTHINVDGEFFESIDDIDEEQKDRHNLSRRRVMPLPTMRANPETNPEALYGPGTTVMAIYPQTTCFYKGVIKEPPGGAAEDYQILFEDPSYADGYSPPLNVAQRYTIQVTEKKKAK